CSSRLVQRARRLLQHGKVRLEKSQRLLGKSAALRRLSSDVLLLAAAPLNLPPPPACCTRHRTLDGWCAARVYFPWDNHALRSRGASAANGTAMPDPLPPRHDLSDPLARARQRSEELRHRAEAGDGVAAEAVVELETALEELTVAEQTLLAQNEQLLAAQEQVEAERRRYSDLFEFAPDAYLVTDLSGTIGEANWAASALLGRPQARLVG